ncbi:cytochrome C [Neobacillus sp. PS3-12]|jgi:mono/diheme cytochrome c family protein|uniref:cytochrome C n=1 Tax=Neobacillus sp. PS3-12 TaxID=3070677 RepID=UPI0027E15BED|nr:cytochrome C [Neobacillus sp. PS3-12]WML55348.1 cytochrome C [Neobacillus sp. PS3-12]
MNKAILSFVISAIVGLMFGYVLYDLAGGNGFSNQEKTATAQTASPSTNATADQSSSSTKTDTSTATKDTASKATAVDQDNIIAKRGCIQCHSVGSLNIKGGQVGPDLSQAYTTVESKHGKPIEEFLKQPTSAVMSGVLGKDPLTDDQRQQVLDLLKKASEAKQ